MAYAAAEAKGSDSATLGADSAGAIEQVGHVAELTGGAEVGRLRQPASTVRGFGAEVGGPDQRTERVVRIAATEHPACGFLEPLRDAFIGVHGRRGEMPDVAVGVGREHLREPRVRVEAFGEGRLLDDCGADDRMTEAHLLTSSVDEEQLGLFAGMEVGHERVAADRVEDLQLAGLDERGGQQQLATFAVEARDPRAANDVCSRGLRGSTFGIGLWAVRWESLSAIGSSSSASGFSFSFGEQPIPDRRCERGKPSRQQLAPWRLRPTDAP